MTNQDRLLEHWQKLVDRRDAEVIALAKENAELKAKVKELQEHIYGDNND